MPIELNDGPSHQIGIQRDPSDPIPRNHNGWPVVPHPEKPGETLVCHRPSGIVKQYLAQTFQLDRYDTRCIAKGAGLQPDLAEMAAVLDLKEDSAQLNDIAQRMAVAGGREYGANRGTARHTILEKLFLGKPVDIPEHFKADVAAIQQCLTDHNIVPLDGWVERFVICPDVPGAGSGDANVTSNWSRKPHVLDLKCGQNDPREYSLAEYSGQTSIYARAPYAWAGVYLDDDGVQQNHPILDTPDLDLDIGLILWAPAGQGTAEIIALDLQRGWRLVQLCKEVRDEARRGVASIELKERRPVPQTLTEDLTEAPAASVKDVEGMARELRRRLRLLVEEFPDITPRISSEWPTGVPTLLDVRLHTAGTIARLTEFVTAIEVEFRFVKPDDELRATWMRVASALPDDLSAMAKERANCPNLRSRKLRLVHLDRLEPILDSAREVHARRVSDLRQASAAMDALSSSGAATMSAFGKPFNDYTQDEADKFLALSYVYVEYPDADLVTVLTDLHDGKRNVVAAAKIIADVYALPKPKSTQDVADNPVLAALTIKAAPQPQTTNTESDA